MSITINRESSFRQITLAPVAALRMALVAASVSMIGCTGPLAGGGNTAEGWSTVPPLTDGPGDQALVAAGLNEPVRNLPKSARGNMAEYTVFGKTYRTLRSAEGFRERGVASWYGRKFHGRETSSGEPFDMYQLTAAHRSLPLPTFVRVTHATNGRSIVVKVNDRGPFADDRVLDLSYAAAMQLDMLGTGTAEVRIEALTTHQVVDAPSLPEVEIATPHDPPREVPTIALASPGPGAQAGPQPELDAGSGRDVLLGAAVSANRRTEADASNGTREIQLGAFTDDQRAQALARRAAEHLPTNPRVVQEPGSDLWRVRAGPFVDAAAADAALAGLATAGIEGYTLVTPSPR